MAAALLICGATLGCPRYSHLANQIRPLPPFEEGQIKDLRSLEEVTFLVFGDSGDKGRAKMVVADGMKSACDSGCDFALVLGDNIYKNGVDSVEDEDFQTRFADAYGQFGRMDFWVVPGNHDWRKPQSVQAEINYTLKSDQWRMPSNHFSIPLLPDWLHLYGLDTTVMHDAHWTSDVDKEKALTENREKQFAAATESLRGKPGWRLLFGHHAVYSGGKHGYERGSCAVLEAIQKSVQESVIRECDVDVYFAGHDHHQELLFAKEADFYQVVQGAASDLRKVYKRHDDGVEQKFICSEYGFLLARASRNSLKMTFYGCGEKGEPASCRPIYDATLRRANDGTLDFSDNVASKCTVQGPKSCSRNWQP